MSSYRDFTVYVNLDARSMSRRGFGGVLILDNEHDIEHKFITDIEDLEKLEVEKDSKLYKLTEQMLQPDPYQNFRPKSVSVIAKKGEGADTFTELLSDAIKEGVDFFYYVATDSTQETVIALALESEKLEKIYATTVRTKEVLMAVKDAVSVGERVIIPVHEDDNFMGETLAAKLAGITPGKTTGKFQALNGVTKSEMGMTEMLELHKLGSFSYKEELGWKCTSEGLVLSGEFIDNILGKYFVKFTLEEAAFELAYNKSNAGSKVGMDDTGIAEYVSVVDDVMSMATTNEIIFKHEVHFLSRAELEKKDIKDRHLKGIRAIGYLKNAVHTGEFNIDLIVEEGK